jgi:hypothetical protein
MCEEFRRGSRKIVCIKSVEETIEEEWTHASVMTPAIYVEVEQSIDALKVVRIPSGLS